MQSRDITLRGVDGDKLDTDESGTEEWESLFGSRSNTEAASARVFVDDFGTMHWPVLFMYPEYTQTDLISQVSCQISIPDTLSMWQLSTLRMKREATKSLFPISWAVEMNYIHVFTRYAIRV